MSRHISVDESYDQDRGQLTLFLVEEDGIVSGIYWDEDYAIQNARWTAEASDAEQVVVTQVQFARASAKEIFDATESDDDETA